MSKASRTYKAPMMAAMPSRPRIWKGSLGGGAVTMISSLPHDPEQSSQEHGSSPLWNVATVNQQLEYMQTFDYNLCQSEGVEASKVEFQSPGITIYKN